MICPRTAVIETSEKPGPDRPEVLELGRERRVQLPADDHRQQLAVADRVDVRRSADGPVAQHGDPVGELADLGEPVGDVDDRGAVRDRASNEREEQVDGVLAEWRSRLVEHQQLRPDGERLRDLEQMLLRHAQRFHPVVQVHLQPDTREQGARRGRDVGARLRREERGRQRQP
jgi:hypothetical protein